MISIKSVFVKKGEEVQFDGTVEVIEANAVFNKNGDLKGHLLLLKITEAGSSWNNPYAWTDNHGTNFSVTRYSKNPSVLGTGGSD